MKRIWRVIPVFFILAVLVFGLAGVAEAAEKTDPYRQQMLQGIREKQKVMEEVRARRKTGPAANGDSDYVYVDGPIDFACTGTKAPTKTLKFTATLTDGPIRPTMIFSGISLTRRETRAASSLLPVKTRGERRSPTSFTARGPIRPLFR